MPRPSKKRQSRKKKSEYVMVEAPARRRVSKRPSRKVEVIQEQPEFERMRESVSRHTSGVGRRVGRAIGGWVGGMAQNILGRFTGLGDYKFKRNSIVTGTEQVPFMHSGKDGVRVRHREFIGDINSSTSFVNSSYSMNPGLSDSFPWLSALAQNFEEYRWEGLVFEFKSTSADALNSTNTALGTIILAAEYNAAAANYINKQQAENTMWAVSTKPSCDTLLPIECMPTLNPLANHYVRIGAVPSGQDIRLYDLCNVQVMSVGSQAIASVGELWVSYDVVLLKPQLSSGLNLAGQTAHYSLNAVGSTGPFGSSQTKRYDSMGLTFIDPNHVELPLGSQGIYMLNYLTTGTGTVSLASFSLSYTGASALSYWENEGSNNVNNGTNSATTYFQNNIFNVPDPTVNAYINLGTGGTLPSGPIVGDLFINQLNGNLTS
jgi:hypothetical protein